MDRSLLEEQMAELPLYFYDFFSPSELEFSPRVRWVCEHECPRYGSSWACPPAVGTVDSCRDRCRSYACCLLIATVAEISDIGDMEEALATRPAHEEITNRVRDLLRAQGTEPYILSTESCALCPRCAYPDGRPCRFPDRMHPCLESHAINIVPILEQRGLEFQFGSNIITWVSLLFY